MPARKEREGEAPGRSGLLVYPALSRRSGGLSLGVNLFPDGKRCSFDCAYCEVVPGAGTSPFTIAGLEAEFASWASRLSAGPFLSSVDAEGDDGERASLPPPVDIAFAGDGEPTLSPLVAEAIEAAAAARRLWPAVFGSVKLVLITNSTGFLDEGVAAMLHRAVAVHGLELWAKLDAGTEAWYRRIDRRGPDFEALYESLAAFSRVSPVVIQAMFCAIAEDAASPSHPPPMREIDAWIGRIARLLDEGSRLVEIHVYTQSRPSPHGLTAPLEDDAVAAIARRLSSLLGANETRNPNTLPLIRAFGKAMELGAPGGSF